MDSVVRNGTTNLLVQKRRFPDIEAVPVTFVTQAPLRLLEESMSTMKLSLVLLGSILSSAGGSPQNSPLQVVPSIDYSRYAGTWYEIARFPNRFQQTCTGDVTATYTLLDNGDVEVVNRCRKDDGEWTEANGIARRLSEEEPNSKLQVRFAPAWLSFLPFVWGDYWVIDLAEDYSFALVGDPDREYLWVLARTPSLNDSSYARLLETARGQGFDTSRLVPTSHSE